MIYYLFENILERKRLPQWQVAVLYALVGVLFMLISTCIPIPRLRTLAGLLSALLPLHLYQNKWREKLVTGLMYIAIQAVVEMTIKAVFLSIYGDNELAAAQYYEASVLVSKALALLVIYLMVSLFRVRAKTLSLKLFVPLLVLPTATIITIYEFIEVSYITDMRSGYMQLLLASLLLVGANIAMCYLFGRMSEMEDMRRRESLSQMQIALQQKQYTLLAESQQDVRRAEHDRKRQLHLIASFLVDGEIQEALDYIQQQEVAVSQERPIITGYNLIDSVLASKRALAQKLGIQLTCEAHWQPDLPLPQTDLAVMLDNGLDNAIEAVVQMSDQDNRWVSVELRQQQLQLHMIIANPVEQMVDTSQGLPSTTKQDAGNHGLGLGNINKLAQQHEGTMSLACENHIVTLRIMVKISNDDIRSV